jgi:flavin-binding protein dodecin
MSEHKTIELAGSSTTAIEDSIQNARSRASKTLPHLR